MEELIYVDRRNSNCNKWDGQTAMFGEEGLHAMWVADMDFKIPQCVQKALPLLIPFIFLCRQNILLLFCRNFFNYNSILIRKYPLILKI